MDIFKGNERRQHNREKIYSPISYEMKTSHEFGATLTRDMSEGGIRIILDKFLPNNTIMKFGLRLGEMPSAVAALGTVRWSQQIPYSDRYEMGIRFTEIEETHRMILAEFLREQRLKAAFNTIR